MFNKFKNMDNNKKIFIAITIAVVVIVFIILFSVFKRQSSNYKNIKEDSNKALVYTINSKKNDIFYIDIPYLNIKGSLGKNINDDINLFVFDYMENDKVIISYEYNVSGNILSLIVKMVDYSDGNVPIPYFRSYNMNLKTNELLTNDIILSNFNITEDDVYALIENKFINWYQEIVEDGYFDENECDYDCFLGYRGVDNYLDDVAYYIEKGRLVLYKPFIFYSIYGEEEFFKEKDFKFNIVD